MKWVADFNHPKKWRFEIKSEVLHDVVNRQKGIGYYLYVYEKDKDIFDYLQDSLEIAKKQALEDFGVPLDAWKQVKN